MLYGLGGLNRILLYRQQYEYVKLELTKHSGLVSFPVVSLVFYVSFCYGPGNPRIEDFLGFALEVWSFKFLFHLHVGFWRNLVVNRALNLEIQVSMMLCNLSSLGFHVTLERLSVRYLLKGVQWISWNLIFRFRMLW